jgi:hypothetical protein
MPLYRPRWYSEPVVPGDLTVIFMTLNKPPKHWQEFHKKKLMEAIEDKPLIIITKNRIDWDRLNTQYLYQEEPGRSKEERVHNIYFQIREAMKLVNTPYIALADDDTLYTQEHFNFYRPPDNKLSYNFCRWHINEWRRDDTCYIHAPNPDNPVLIAPAKKFKDHLDPVSIFRGKTTVFMNDCVSFYTLEPVLSFHHLNGLVGRRIKHRQNQKLWPVRSLSIPIWGLASEIIKEWREED